MREIIFNAHIHTRFSDGLRTHREIAAIAAHCGLDAIFISDHNVFPNNIGCYYQFNNNRIMVIVGEEIHDVNRYPQKSHLLAFNINRTFNKYADQPQELIDQIQSNGGLSFIAHAYDPAVPELGEDDLSWEDWNVNGFTGIEIWNNLSEFKIRFRNKIQSYFSALFPSFLAVQAPRENLEIWDKLLIQHKRLIVGMGGSDAHTIPYKIRQLKLQLFPYRYHFKTINNHLLINGDLTGEYDTDVAKVFSAVKRGSMFVANDQIYPSSGFRCWIEHEGQEFGMGGTQFNIDPDNPPLLKVNLPARADCVILRNGLRYKKFPRQQNFQCLLRKPGIYRLECFRNFRFKKRGWIYSNPFILV